MKCFQCRTVELVGVETARTLTIPSNVAFIVVLSHMY